MGYVLSILLLALVILALPYVLFMICQQLFNAEMMSVEHSDSLFAQARRKMPRLYISGQLPIEMLVFPHFLGRQIIFSEEVWNAWSTEERQACLFWCEALRLRYSSLRLLTGMFVEVQLVDRDSVLMGASSLSLVSSLEKAERFRNPETGSFWVSFLEGWSYLGSSWLYRWPKAMDRSSDLARAITKLEAEG